MTISKEFEADLLFLYNNGVSEDILISIIHSILSVSESEAEKVFRDFIVSHVEGGVLSEDALFDNLKLSIEEYQKVINSLRLGQPSSVFATLGNKKYRDLIKEIDRSIRLNHHKIMLVNGDWGTGKTTLSKSLISVLKESAERYKLNLNVCFFNFPNSIKNPSSISQALYDSYTIPLIEILSMPGAFPDYVSSLKNYPSGQKAMIKNLVKIHEFSSSTEELSLLIDDYLFSGRIQGLNNTIGRRSNTKIDKPEWTLTNIAGDKVQHASFLKFSVELQKHLGFYPVFVIDEIDILAQRSNDRGMALDWLRDIIDIAAEKSCGLIINSTPDVTEEMFLEYPAIEGRLAYDTILPSSPVVELTREDEDRKAIVLKTLHFYLNSLEIEDREIFSRLMSVFKDYFAYYLGQMTTWDGEFDSLRVFIKAVVIELDHLKFKSIPSAHMLKVCSYNSEGLKDDSKRIISNLDIENLFASAEDSGSNVSNKEGVVTQDMVTESEPTVDHSVEASKDLEETVAPLEPLIPFDAELTTEPTYSFQDNPGFKGVTQKSLDILIVKYMDLIKRVLDLALENKEKVGVDITKKVLRSALLSPEVMEDAIKYITVERAIPVRNLVFDSKKAYKNIADGVVSCLIKGVCSVEDAVNTLVSSFYSCYEKKCFEAALKDIPVRRKEWSLKAFGKRTQTKDIQGLALTLAREIANNRINVTFDGDLVQMPNNNSYCNKKIIHSTIVQERSLLPLCVQGNFLKGLYQGIGELSCRYFRDYSLLEKLEDAVNENSEDFRLYDVSLDMPIESPQDILASLILRKLASKAAFSTPEIVLEMNDVIQSLMKTSIIEPVKFIKSRNGLYLKAEISRKDGTTNLIQVKDFKVTIVRN